MLGNAHVTFSLLGSDIQCRVYQSNYMHMKIITTKMHGVVDYVVGIALILAPMIFGFAEVGGAAVSVPRVLGVALIVYSLLTRYELGLLRILPMRLHLGIDYVASIFLAASPWIFGFSAEAPNAWVPHVVVGVAVFFIALMTQREPQNVPSLRTM